MESPVILSSLQPLNRSFEFDSKLYETAGIPAVIRVVSITKPFARNPMILLRLRNVFDPISDPRGTAGEAKASLYDMKGQPGNSGKFREKDTEVGFGMVHFF